MTARSILPNGVQILSRALPGRRSAAVGLWLRGGVRAQRPGEDGYAHLLEHLLYRGGGTADLEPFGGHVNAGTARELTVLHGLAGANAAGLAARFAVRLARPELSAEGLLTEARAVLNEIADAENDLQSAVEERLVRLAWQGHPMARPLLGTPAAVAGCEPDALAGFHGRIARGPRVCVVAVGAVDHGDLVEACQPLGELPAELPGAPGAERPLPPRFLGRTLRQPLPGERALVGWLMPAPGLGHPEQPACTLAEHLVAGELRSELRDRLGLIYDLDSRLELHSDCGLWWLRLACDAREAERCQQIVETRFERLAAAPPDGEAVLHAFHRLRARWLIEDDDLEHNLQRIALEALFLGRVQSLDRRLAALAAVDGQGVARTLGHCWSRRARLACGPGAIHPARQAAGFR